MLNINLEDNLIIICEDNYKKKILKELSKTKRLINIKFYNMSSFLKEYLFDYSEETIYYLIDKYKYKVDIAREYIKNLYYIKDKEYKNKKIQKLRIIKEELDKEKLLVYNNNFKDFISNKKIYIYGYDYLDKYQEEMFNKLSNVTMIEKTLNNYIPKVYEFENCEEEIEYIAREISKLIVSGVNINNIKLANINEEYYNTIKRVFSFYNIPINISNTNSIYSTNIGKIFIDNFNSDISVTLSSIKDMDNDIVNKIINICNRYVFLDDYLKAKDLIIYDLKNASINIDFLESAIEIIELGEAEENDYVFLPSFNIGNIPLVIKDENYITDTNKEELDLYSTVEINKRVKTATINNIKNIKNLIVTYKNKSKSKESYPSVLIDEMNLKVEKLDINITKGYSKIADKLTYAKRIDNLIKYGIISNDISILNKTYQDLPYNKYSNTFSGVDKDYLYEFINNKLVLSYSTLNTYNKCAFRYYIQNILKLDPFVENFMTLIGSLFHYVLEKKLKNDSFDIKILVDEYLKDNYSNTNTKEKYFINKLIEEIKFVIEVIKKHNEFTSCKETLYEEKIYLNKDKNIKVTFMGVIDKVLLSENENTKIAMLLDYKTGSTDIDLKYVPFGINMQLPIYIYLFKNSNKIENVKFAGFYLQKIFNEIPTINKNKTYIETKEDNLKLYGYTTDNINRISSFDSTFENSEMIKGLKIKKDGNLAKTAKTLNDDDMDKLINIVDEKVNETIENILEGKFDINPKRIDYEDYIGCQYCKFNDLCFKNEKDYVNLETIENNNFLGGDDNAKVDSGTTISN